VAGHNAGLGRVSPLRVWLIGFGTVGRWLADALDTRAQRLASRFGCEVQVVGIANARDGFIYDAGGLNLRSTLTAAAAGEPITTQAGARTWPTALDGLRATESDLLVEVTASPRSDAEPGLSHMREALQRGIPVVTANKWPVARYGTELAALARSRGVAFRAESTVMSGTPVLSTLTEGLAGAVPLGLRGVLNATANAILTQMADGTSYEQALAAAQRAGLAEPDPAADVEGWDTVAKVMILSALVFGRQLTLEQVTCRGITGVTGQQAREAAAAGQRIRHIATLEFAGPDGTAPDRTGPDGTGQRGAGPEASGAEASGPEASGAEGAGAVTARVQPETVPADDLLARIDGVANAVVCRARPVGEVTIIGPGAGPQLAGQGVLSDLIAVARQRSAGP
jgi:homoserine dehydrogenase